MTGHEYVNYTEWFRAGPWADFCFSGFDLKANRIRNRAF
jgi:hypothetical protein